MNYGKRINKLRIEMRKMGLNGILIASDASWEYIAGIPRLGGGNTKQRQNSLEYACLLITEEKSIAFLPKLNWIVIMAKIGETKPFAEFIAYEDGDLTGRAFEKKLKELKLEGKTVGVTQDIQAPVVLKLQNQLNIKVVDASDIILGMRSIKDEEELAIMRKAAEITDNIYDDLLTQLKPGVSVREMEFELDRLIEKHGASKSSFPGEINNHGPKSGPMVGFSYHTIEKGYVLGLDFGVVYKGYCTDFGRTIFVGEPETEFVKMYDAVYRAQKMAIEMFKENNCTCDDINQAAREVIEAEGYGERFIHKLGHGIGMDVHERPFLARGEMMKIKPGMTFAVEPSIFIPQRCFIRLEDVVLATDKGYENLSKITKEIVVIE